MIGALLLAALSPALLLFGSDTLTPPQASDPVTDLLGGRINVRLLDELKRVVSTLRIGQSK